MKKLELGLLVAAIVLGAAAWWLRREPPAAPAIVPVVNAASPAEPPTTQHAPTTHDATLRSRELARAIERALVAVDPAARETAFNSLLPELMRVDAAEAGRMVLQQQPGEQRAALRSQVVQQWIAIDREAASEWIARLTDDDERAAAATDAFTQLARGNPADAVQIADRFGIGRDDGTLEHLVQTWTAAEPRAALKWIDAQPPGPATDQLRARRAYALVDAQPAAAAEMAVSGLPAGELQADTIAMIARQWAMRDPAAARGWVTRLPPGAGRSRAEAELARVSPP